MEVTAGTDPSSRASAGIVPNRQSVTQCKKTGEEGAGITSLSQVELSVSMAMGLLGALLPGTGGMTWSPGWFAHGKLTTWLACLLAKVVERYCFTCCLCACCMWYLVGFSRWVCT